MRRASMSEPLIPEAVALRRIADSLESIAKTAQLIAKLVNFAVSMVAGSEKLLSQHVPAQATAFKRAVGAWRNRTMDTLIKRFSK